MTHPLTIRLLGTFSLAWHDREVPLPAGHTRDLAALLALNAGRPQGRTSVAVALWGDCDDAAARKRLRIALWRLKRALEAVGADPDLMLSTHQQLRLLPGPEVWIDVDQFTRHLDHGHPRSVQAAVELYRGDLLEDCFDEWCEAPRRELRDRFLTALRTLMDQASAGGDPAGAIRWGRRLLQYDALFEDAHRELMRCFHTLGDRGAALRQFASCRRILASELGLEPMEETMELYRQIRLGAVLRPPPASHSGDAIGDEADRVREELDSLALLVRRARTRLDRLLARLATGDGSAASTGPRETAGRR